MNFVHKLINKGYKDIFPIVGIKEYIKLCPQELVKFKQSTKFDPHEF